MSVQSQEWRSCHTGLGRRKCHHPLVMSAADVSGEDGVYLLPQTVVRFHLTRLYINFSVVGASQWSLYCSPSYSQDLARSLNPQTT